MDTLDICRPYMKDDGDFVYGNAAMLHNISEIGGIKKYNEMVCMEYNRERLDIYAKKANQLSVLLLFTTTAIRLAKQVYDDVKFIKEKETC